MKQFSITLVAALFFFLVIPANLTGQDTEEEVIAVRITYPVKVDALLEEELYSSTPNQTFIQFNPDNGEPATEKTDVWIGYDNQALYVGARLWESQPDSIIGRMGRRDVSTNSDEFVIAFDSYYDKRSAFYFSINPSGTIGDGTASNDSWFDDTWDGVWEGRAAIDDQGWTVEMRIPFSQLRFNEQDEYIWGVGFSRKIQRRNEQSLNTHLPRGESGIVSHFATLRGIRDIVPPKRLELLPYFTSGYSDLPSQSENPFFEGHDSNVNVGADIKFGIGNNITVDATINPDFGQVEVDPSVINLSAYETYYQEKRPLFVEGASIFSFGTGGPTNRWGFNFWEPDFFYSRRIGRPPQGRVESDGWVDTPQTTSILGAAKISGKFNGGWSLGGLSALTGREYASINENGSISEKEVEPATFYNLLRTHKEFNEGLQGLGVLGTYVLRNFKDLSLRDVLSDNAFALGVDGWTFLNEKKDWVLSGWGGITRVSGTKIRILALQHNSSHYFQRPDAEHVAVDSSAQEMTGYAGRFFLNKETGHLIFNAALGIISPSFESNDMGLAFSTDRINKHIVLGYRWYDPGKIFRFVMLNAAYMSNHDFAGNKTSERVFLFGYAQLLNYWHFNGFMGVGPRTLDPSKLRGGPMVISPAGVFINGGIGSDSRKSVVFGFGGNAGQNERASGSQNWSLYSWVEIKLGTRANLSFSPNYSASTTSDQYVMSIKDENATEMYGKRYILAQIDQKNLSADIRIDYTFTPTLSLQAYVQPFIAVGAYSHFKEFKQPNSYDFMLYGEEGSTIKDTSGGYILDPTGADNGDAFFVYNPDFNYKALIGNLVLRWEFKPGSTLYAVWTRDGADYSNPGNFNFSRDLSHLLEATSDNILTIKLSYWIG